MPAQTLDELKAENAAAETKAEETTAVETVEEEVKAAEVNEDDNQTVAEQDDEESEDETVPAWMQSEESDDEGSFNNHDMAAMRKKLRAKADKKLNEKDDEIAELRARIEAMQAPQQIQQASVKVAPKLEDFDYDDAKFQQAMSEYISSQVVEQVSTVTQTAQQQQAQMQAAQEMAKAVDSHYERAVKLTQESGIDSEVFRQSDLSVRQAVASIPQFQQNANEVVDHLISLIGDGSEKVMYYLGRNKTEQAKLLSTIQSDPTGIQTGMLIGELKSKVTQPVQKISKARKPASRADGGDESSVITSLKRKYDKAKTTQDRYEIRRAAKKAGEDTRSW